MKKIDIAALEKAYNEAWIFKMKKAASVDEYIASYPKDVQDRLKTVRKIVKEVAPDAQEKLSYGMPYYNLNGRLIYFAAAKNHLGLYSMPSSIVTFAKELKGYQTSTGTIRFPYSEPLPVNLIRKILKYRVEENRAKKPKSSY